MPLSPYFTSHSPSVMDAENQDHFVDRVNKKHCLKNIIATCFALKKKYKRSGNFKPYSFFFFWSLFDNEIAQDSICAELWLYLL